MDRAGQEMTGDFPSSLKVGYIDYRIESWEHAQADSAGRYGETDRVRRIVRIDMSHGTVQGAETLLHEIFHCVWEMWGLPGTDTEATCEEEPLVSTISKGLATIWRDNPEVFAWIDTHLQPRKA